MAMQARVRGLAFVALAATVIAAPLAGRAQPAAAPGDGVRTRVLAWPGGDRLYVSTNADVRYVQGAQGKVVITGPARDIEDIVVDHGVVRHARAHWGWPWWTWGEWPPSRSVHIVVTAPHVDEAGISGSGHLDLGRLAQDHLALSIAGSGAIDVSGQFKSLDLSVSGSGAVRLSQVSAAAMSASLSGSGWIKAAGAAGTLHVSISGSGAADMGGLVAQDVTTQISGSGFAKVSPRRSADLSVAGSGAIRLLTQPAQLSTHRSGSGSIISPNGRA